MKRERLYIVIILCLVCVNILLLLTHPMTRGNNRTFLPHGHPRDFQHTAVDMLELETQEAKYYRRLTRDHHAEIKDLNLQQIQYFESYFKESDSISVEDILHLERRKIEVTQAHFRDVRKLVGKEKETEFTHFLEEAIEIILQ